MAELEYPKVLEQHLGDCVVRVLYDEDAPNPREWMDHLGTMVCWHRRHRLGDACTDSGHLELGKPFFSEPDEFVAWFRKQQGAQMLPLYLYDHSGLTMRTYPFSCPWDSGQVGWIYATRESILDWFQKKHLTPKLIERAQRCLIAEVEEYNHYLTGQVYGYVITREHRCPECQRGNTEVLDCRWGFYGDPEYCLAEGVAAAFRLEEAQ